MFLHNLQVLYSLNWRSFWMSPYHIINKGNKSEIYDILLSDDTQQNRQCWITLSNTKSGKRRSLNRDFKQTPQKVKTPKRHNKCRKAHRFIRNSLHIYYFGKLSKFNSKQTNENLKVQNFRNNSLSPTVHTNYMYCELVPFNSVNTKWMVTLINAYHHHASSHWKTWCISLLCIKYA